MLQLSNLEPGLEILDERLLFGRLVPAVRTLISVPAGIANMPLPKFLLYSTVGSLAWTGLLTATGYLLEDKYTQVAKYVDPVSKLILGLRKPSKEMAAADDGSKKKPPGVSAGGLVERPGINGCGWPLRCR
jgi:hypothetical protein